MKGNEPLGPPQGLIEIEGLAMNGLLESFELKDCKKPKGYKYIEARSKGGRTLRTGCMSDEDARRQAAVLNLYMRQWSSLIVQGGEGQ
ncbi:MAG: hypothetical protein OSP8Acid_06210 [uncultured Acidilobus sp. OSP8]|nr:MAG: hypothetical protein OSP8Acid_06210 [uncultured Acidilobus sp. OSP8]